MRPSSPGDEAIHMGLWGREQVKSPRRMMDLTEGRKNDIVIIMRSLNSFIVLATRCVGHTDGIELLELFDCHNSDKTELFLNITFLHRCYSSFVPSVVEFLLNPLCFLVELVCSYLHPFRRANLSFLATCDSRTLFSFLGFQAKNRSAIVKTSCVRVNKREIHSLCWRSSRSIHDSCIVVHGNHIFQVLV